MDDEKYFATEGQEHAAIGSLLCKRKDVEKHLRLLESEAGEIGEELGVLARLLTTKPASVLIQGQPFDPKYCSPEVVFAFNIQQIGKLTHEIRETRDRLDRLDEKARRLGF